MKNKEKNDINIDELMSDYKPHNDDIFDEDTALLSMLKSIIFCDLSEAERRVLLMYAEIGSQRELGKELGVSAASINIYLNKIRAKIAQIRLGKNVLDKSDTDKCSNLLLD
jgi:DNA-directed RNA polymerase specialized sigma subunit